MTDDATQVTWDPEASGNIAWYETPEPARWRVVRIPAFKDDD